MVRYFRSPAVPGWRKLSVVGAFLYVIIPLDAVPDFVPWIGWLDDLGVVGAVLAFLVRDVRRHAERWSSDGLVKSSAQARRQAALSALTGEGHASPLARR